MLNPLGGLAHQENRLAQLVCFPYDWNTWFLNISGVLQVEKEVSKTWILKIYGVEIL